MVIYFSDEMYDDYSEEEDGFTSKRAKRIASNDKTKSLREAQIKLRKQLADTKQQLRQFNAVDGDKVRFLFLTTEVSSLLYSGKYFDDKDGDKCIKVKKANHMPIDKKSEGMSSMVGSCNGLVCFSVLYTTRIEDPIYICNLKCREQVSLPRFTVMARNKNNVEFKKTQHLDGDLVSGFGYCSITDEFKVVRIYYPGEEAKQGQVQVYTLGSGSGWRDKGLIPFSLQRYGYGRERKIQVRRVHHKICLPARGIHANGALYWLVEGWNVVSLDIASENFSLLPKPPCFRRGEPNFYMLQEVGGCLCVVYGYDENPEIDLMRKQDYTLCQFGFDGKNHLDIWSFKKENSEWGIMYNIPYHPPFKLMDVYWPITLTVSGKLLLRSDYKTLVRYDPQTKTFEEIEDLKVFDPCEDLPLIEVIPYTKSYVSLKALGEKSKTMEDVDDHEYEHWLLKRKKH